MIIEKNRAGTDRTTAAFFRRVIEALPDGVAVLDSRGVVVAANRRWAQSREGDARGRFYAPVGASLLEALRGEAQADVARRVLYGLEALLAGKQDHFSQEYPVDAPEGREWFLLEAQPFEPGGVILRRTDVSAHKRREDALREREANDRRQLDELAWVYQNAPIGLCLLDLDLRYLRVNRTLAELNGYPVEAHIGRSVADVVPALAGRVKQVTQRILATRRAYKDVEFKGETAAQPGVRRYWSSNWHPVLDGDGNIVGFGAVMEETTERRAVEKALLDYAGRQSFLVRLGDALRQQTDPMDIQRTACRLLGRHLHVDRVYFGEILEDGDLSVVHTEFFREGLRAMSGRRSMAPEALEELKAGRPLVIADTGDPESSALSTIDGVRSLGIGALAAAPLLAGDKLVSTLNVVSSSPRAWTEGEVDLIADVAARAWDAVKRALAETALQESEQRERRRAAELQAIFDTAPIGLAIAVEPRGEKIVGNRALERTFGLPEGAELSKAAREPAAFRAFQNGREVLTAELPMQRAVHGDVVGGEVLDILRDDGERVIVFAKATPLYDEAGEPRGAVGAFMDITKIKRAEEALRDSEARLQQALDAANAGVWEYFPETGVFTASARAKALHGLPANAPLSFERALVAVVPADRPAVRAALRNSLDAGAPFRVELRAPLPDGSSRWLSSIAELRGEGANRRFVGLVQDIDERKRSEVALRESEERQAFLLKFADALRQLVDPGEIQATACRLLGEYLGLNRVSYADIDGDEFVVRQSYAKGVGPFMVRMPVSDLGQALIDSYRREETVAVENVFASPAFTAEERERFKAAEIVALASVVLTKQGRWVGTLCAHNAAPRSWSALEIRLVREVADRIWSAAERARVQVALRESELRLQLALTSGKIGIYEWRIEADELIWDDRLRAQWGLPPGAPLSFAVFMQGVHLADRDRVRSVVEKALDPAGPGSLYVEYRVVPFDGQGERWIAATGTVFFDDGRAIRMVGTAQDVSERKRAEAERQKFVSLAEQSMEFIRICSLEFEPLYLNPAGAELVGLEREQALRTPVADYFFPEDREYVFAGFHEKVLREGHANVEIRFRHFRTGEALWMLYNVFVLRDSRGEPIGFATVSRDITERKRAEDALRAADRRKDEFLATLAHELRNPLAPIRNAIHILRGGAGAADKRDLALLAMIERQTEHLIRLVDDLLEVSRITRGKIELRRRKIDLADVLRHALETAAPTIGRGGHRLDVALPPEPLLVDGDPVRLAQVFTNLLNNAAKYTEHGGDIALAAGRQGCDIVVTVRDSGVGIPAEMLPRVFDLFTQVDRTLGRAQGGLGIGLALVRSLLDLHGGSVEARSEGLGRGSAFVVRLPAVSEDETEEAMSESSAAAKSAVTRRVLVIDDDRDVADSLAMFLETFGAAVCVTYGGADGLDAMPSFKPDLVFLDLGMPQMDGYETARRIRALPEGRDVMLVALSGWGEDQVSDRAREAGFDRQLTKPASFEALQELLAAG